MATSLSGKSIGAPDNGFTWYLQTGGVSLATGFPVATGNGTETPLWLDADGIGVRSSGGFVSKIKSLATATRACELADAAGVIQPAQQARLAADAVNSTTTPATVADLALTLEASSLYEIEGVLLAKSAATATGVQLRLTGPAAQTDFVAYEVGHNTTATLGTGNFRRQLLNAFDTNLANADAPTANTVFPIYIRGFLKTTGTTPASGLGLQFNSEVGASAVTLAAGSFLRIKRIS
jgi:hypothetical protein